MKFNFSFDIAVFTTIFTIYLFVCGFFYYDGLISYYGFNHVSLGISIQDYLMYGWVITLEVHAAKPWIRENFERERAFQQRKTMAVRLQKSLTRTYPKSFKRAKGSLFWA